MVNTKKMYESWNIQDCKTSKKTRNGAKSKNFFKRVANKLVRRQFKLELIGA